MRHLACNCPEPKEDLTNYSDDELSLRVMNDEGLYIMRRQLAYLLETLNDLFIFTDDQRRVLLTDLDEDATYND